MSRASKLTLLGSLVFTTATILGVHYMQELDSKVRRIGISKLDERRSEKRIANELEYLRQEELRQQLQMEQAVSTKSYREQQSSAPPPPPPPPASSSQQQ
ncbi:hypothetical protein BC831DRAFT_442400 [Entophlyctis helioformis]|nr:hypothetical protein BC831DRAFT_442400 [Entophlyctis helioformis]